jgi:hypothetical protein
MILLIGLPAREQTIQKQVGQTTYMTAFFTYTIRLFGHTVAD